MFAKTILSAAAAAILTATFAVPTRAQSRNERVPVQYDLQPAYVITYENGHRGCRIATPDEVASLKMRSPGDELHVINGESLSKTTGGPSGFTIVLRGTTQLDNFPAAKAAFIRAAETWMALIRTPITIVIDVDFGPTRFGQPYPPGVLGSTSSQFPDFAYSWSSVRARMISKAVTQAEKDLLAQMPPTTGVPTTEGNCTLVYLSSVPLRALGYLNAVQDPVAEAADLGDPPAIGFNSAFNYDFDPSNGIDSNKQDFNATALHEIGHALGFTSHTGLKELVPSNPVVVTTWDLFRFRPGIALSTFPTAQRVTSSGGEQIEFSGGDTTRLSTGRPNATGGDGNQASHWKDNEQNNGIYIGIMDPTGADGDQDELRPIDLSTLDLIGHDVKGMVNVDSLAARLEANNVISVSGVVTAANRKIRSLVIRILDKNGQEVATADSPDVINGTVQTAFSFTVDKMTDVRGAMIEVTFFDDRDFASPPVAADFTLADAGGSNIATATFNGKKVKFTGSGFAAGAQVEINGTVVSQTVKVKNSSKCSVKGNASALGLRPGTNRIRLIQAGVASNAVFVNL